MATFLVIPKISPKDGIRTKNPKSINKQDNAIKTQPVGFLIFKKNAFMCRGTSRLIYKI